MITVMEQSTKPKNKNKKKKTKERNKENVSHWIQRFDGKFTFK